jgi:hypothetical protein
MRARMIMIVASKKLIQIGDNTQIHGHAITLVSLRPTKRTVSSPGRPIPPEEEEEEDDMVLRAMGKGDYFTRKKID